MVDIVKYTFHRPQPPHLLQIHPLFPAQPLHHHIPYAQDIPERTLATNTAAIQALVKCTAAFVTLTDIVTHLTVYAVKAILFVLMIIHVKQRLFLSHAVQMILR